MQGGELFRFVIPYSPKSLNIVLNKSRWKYHALKQEIQADVMPLLSQLKVPKEPYMFPVRLIFEARWMSKKHRDVDNIVVKPIIDCMKLKGFFVDDDCSHIPEIIYRGTNGEKEGSLTIICERYV